MLPLKDVIPPRTRPRLALAIQIAGAVAVALLVASRTIDRPSAILLVVHLLYICVFADNVEDRLGPSGFALVYLLAHAAGTAAHVTAAPGSEFSVGLTSGSVAGILGAYVVLYPASRVLMLMPLPLELHEVPAPFIMALYFLLHVAGGVAWLADAAAGFVTGAAVCLALRKPVVWEAARRRNIGGRPLPRSGA
jgi:membrane associated rhomboid family serine protease